MSSNGDPSSGYRVTFGSFIYNIGVWSKIINFILKYNLLFFLNIHLGTSAAALLYAGITARLMNIYGVGQVQKDFANGGYYKTLTFNDITSGSNGKYNAGTGWDAVTGLGSFKSYKQSSSNPTTTPAKTSTKCVYVCS